MTYNKVITHKNMDRKRQWYLNNKELVASRERERKEKMKETNEYKERMFVRKLASYHNKTLKILLKPRNKNFDKKEYLAKYRKTYDNKKYRDDEQFRLRKVMRARLHSAFKAQNITKKNRTMEYIGCSTEELKAHIERQFTE